MTEVREATAAMVAEREDADVKACRAIQAIEEQLIAALDGEALRGLPDLGGGVHGLRVGVDGSAFAKLPRGRASLVLEAKGMLVYATIFDNGNAFIQRTAPHRLRASVLVPYVRTVEHALDAHRRSATARAAEFRKIATLSDRIASVLR